MRRSTKWVLLGTAAGTAASVLTGYGMIVRPWHLRWGATHDEVTRRFPFDQIIPHPNYFSTRAVTIDAPINRVWPFVLDPKALPSGTEVQHQEKPHWVAFAPPEPVAKATWVVLLESTPDGATRLISRNRAYFPGKLKAFLRYAMIDPGQFIVERAWLLGIKERAEAANARPVVDGPTGPDANVPEKIEPRSATPESELQLVT
ncbi:MAG: hypothetical protein WA208_02025 [Thermoanaerobaculia bacterium]